MKDKLEQDGAITSKELSFLTHSVLTTDLEQWATANRVPFVDVQNVLDRDRDVIISWVHLSPRGNRMVADALAKKMKPWIGRQGKPLYTDFSPSIAAATASSKSATRQPNTRTGNIP